MTKHTRNELVTYSRADLEGLAKFAAKTRLMSDDDSTFYVGDIGEQIVRWREDGGLEVITPHTPSKWPHDTKAKEIKTDD